MPKRILVTYAPKDASDRDWLVRHFASEQSPYEFTEISAEGPWDAEWKARCRQHIKTCSRVIALVSRNTHAARGTRWQIECAAEEGKPTIGVYICADMKCSYLPELAGCKIIPWTWSAIEAFLAGQIQERWHNPTTLANISRNDSAH